MADNNMEEEDDEFQQALIRQGNATVVYLMKV